ncbi:ABC-2 family transporter protein [Candidatus Gottesmanbacteria bacterium]|nr:ABC-2 family transporter protein [Candidatus Gottesmanbacteria bacterium]
MKKYFHVWWRLTDASFQNFFVSRIGAILFLFGKVVRFVFYLAFLIILISRTQIFAGYNLWQVILFYLTFNFIDSATQMVFREVYRFRQLVLSGNFDLILVKPVNSLFRSLFGGADLLDMITLLPFVIFVGIAAYHVPGVTIFSITLYLLLIFNALWIAMSFHIMVLALAILTTEIDHAIMIYRDFTSMGKLPVDIYSEPLRSFVTFVIPVGVMMTYPAKAMMGLLNINGIIFALSLSLTIFLFSIILWRFSLRRYTSASS